MKLRNRKTCLLVLVAVAAAALLAPPAGPASAGATACKRWGDRKASHLTRAHARRAIGCLLNRVRAHHGLQHARANGHLSRAAQRHTRYMRRHGCFAHQCPGEADLFTRVRSTGYVTAKVSTWGAAENLAAGKRRRSTPRHMVREWMHSSAHRSVILHGTYRNLGVGFVRGLPGRRGAQAGTYTVDFGYRRR